MNRPPPGLLRRPSTTSRRQPRSRTEAAVALVRAEFERERLDRDLDQLSRRAQVAGDARDAAAIRSRQLRRLLDDAGDHAPSDGGGRGR